MKRFLILAAVVGGFFASGLTSTASAHGGGYCGPRVIYQQPYYYGGYDYAPYGYTTPYVLYSQPVYRSGLYINTPRFSVGLGGRYVRSYNRFGYGW